MIETGIEVVVVNGSSAGSQEIVLGGRSGARAVWLWIEAGELCGNGIDAGGGNAVQSEGRAHEVAGGIAYRRLRVIDQDREPRGIAGLREITGNLRGAREGRGGCLLIALALALIAAKEEGAILAVVDAGDEHRATEGEAILVALEDAQLAAGAVQKPIVGVELAVAEILIHAAMEVVD